MYFLHSIGFFNEVSIFIRRSGPGRVSSVGLADSKDVFQTIQSDLDDFVIHGSQQVAKRFDASLESKPKNGLGYLIHEITNLFRLGESATSSVTYCPTSFLFSFEFTMLKQINKGWNKIGVDDGLDLVAVTSRDIRYGPTGFLSYWFFYTGKKTQ